MGSFQGAEICGLIGLYILSEISPITGPSNIGLYRDDGLAIIKQTSGTTLEKIKKSLIKKCLQKALKLQLILATLAQNFLTSRWTYP